MAKLESHAISKEKLADPVRDLGLFSPQV